MLLRYQATLMVWNGRDGSWEPRSLGHYKAKERAALRLARGIRRYTRYERHEDHGEILDRKTGDRISCDGVDTMTHESKKLRMATLREWRLACERDDYIPASKGDMAEIFDLLFDLMKLTDCDDAFELREAIEDYAADYADVEVTRAERDLNAKVDAEDSEDA